MELSFTQNVLMRDGNYIHPVAAMYQLCSLRLRIQNELNSMDGAEWPDLATFEIGDLPKEFMRCTEDLDSLELGGKINKSMYAQSGENRLYELTVDAGRKEYVKKRTDYAADSMALLKDGDMIVTRLALEAQRMLFKRVLLVVAERANAMIEAYRSFFCRFTEQKNRLADRVKRAEMDHSASTETSGIYVGASVESRRRHYEYIAAEGMGGTEASNNVAGKGVFTMAYSMACAKKYKAEEDIRVDTTGVFTAMYEENKKSIKRS